MLGTGALNRLALPDPGGHAAGEWSRILPEQPGRMPPRRTCQPSLPQMTPGKPRWLDRQPNSLRRTGAVSGTTFDHPRLPEIVPTGGTIASLFTTSFALKLRPYLSNTPDSCPARCVESFLGSSSSMEGEIAPASRYNHRFRSSKTAARRKRVALRLSLNETYNTDPGQGVSTVWSIGFKKSCPPGIPDWEKWVRERQLRPSSIGRST